MNRVPIILPIITTTLIHHHPTTLDRPMIQAATTPEAVIPAVAPMAVAAEAATNHNFK